MRILLSVVVLFVSCLSYAQELLYVTGRVCDASGNPLPSVIVRRMAAPQFRMSGFTRTDTNGDFEIRAAAGDSLVFSMLGFGQQRVMVGSANSRLKVVMEDKSIALKEVAVKADRVRMHGDTISYTLGSYAKKGDSSLGDVLKRIPGFDVNSSTGQISYEGRPISNFYIEGMDMLGGKYGVATNSLPQKDIASVDVMKHHHAIRVLDSFTFSDDNAVNIRMKESARQHWLSTWQEEAGAESGEGLLWKTDNMAMRVKSDWQTMITLKANNTGDDVKRESDLLQELTESSVPLSQYIQIEKPSLPNLPTNRTLFNRSVAANVSFLKPLTESSQLTLQVYYNHDRIESEGDTRQIFYDTDSVTREVKNSRLFHETTDHLYAMAKYEKNSENCYLKNELTGDFTWDRQQMTEEGTDPHSQQARLPVTVVKDNVYVIRRYGNRLISFRSNNKLETAPQRLQADDVLSQRVSQSSLSTDTYASGAFKLGGFTLSAKAGATAATRKLQSSAAPVAGTEDISFANDTRFSFVRLYADPSLEFRNTEVSIQLGAPVSLQTSLYAHAGSNTQVYVSPSLQLRWFVTTRYETSLRAEIKKEDMDYNHFFSGAIWQDYRYITLGYEGYRLAGVRTVAWGNRYNDALHSIHLFATLGYSHSTHPYTSAYQYVGDFILRSFSSHETEADSWTGNVLLQKGLPIADMKLTLQTNYVWNKYQIVHDAMTMPATSRQWTTNASVSMSPWKDATVRYTLMHRLNGIEVRQLSNKSTVSNWANILNLTAPITDRWQLLASCEYDDNRLSSNYHKDSFFTDIKVRYISKHLELSLSANNVFNSRTYTANVSNDLYLLTTENRIRGRAILLGVVIKP